MFSNQCETRFGSGNPSGLLAGFGSTSSGSHAAISPIGEQCYRAPGSDAFEIPVQLTQGLPMGIRYQDAASNWTMRVLLLAGVLFAPAGAALAGAGPDRLNIELVGHSDLNGAGKGGEGLALAQYGPRRILFLAHESGPQCFSVIDVSAPAKPLVLAQIPVEADFIRCNSLALSGRILVVARQSEKAGQPHGGIKVYDVTEPSHPTLLSYMDLTGPHSRGTHYLTFTDGRFAYLSTGARDFAPRNPNDDQMLMIVDLKDPAAPREAGRWWIPGTREGDDEPPPARVSPFDTGFRTHTPLVPAERPDRLYLGWIDGGIVILDISDKSRPRQVSRISWQSLHQGFMHTVVPLLERGLLIASQESTKENCRDWPMRIAVIDVHDEARPYPLSTMPPPANFSDLCTAGGRFGAHNINLNHMPDTSRVLKNTVVSAQFAGGVRIYSIRDPLSPTEIAYFAPPVPANKGGAIQMNDILVGSDGLIYANDRFSGGLYILKYTGDTPLD
jgi:hypothetical protein